MSNPTNRAALPITAPVRILLAEDLDIIQEIATLILERSGHTVDVADNGADALALFEGGTYDLVLMDIQMPVLDGTQVARRIRASDHPRRNVPIVAMTANVHSDQIERFLAAGMNDFIAKPFRKETLLRKVRQWAVAEPESGIEIASGATAAPTFRRTDFEEFVSLLGPADVVGCMGLLDALLVATIAMDEGDTQALRKAAHAIIPQAGWLGFADLAMRCTELEQAISAGNIHGQEFGLFCQEARRVANALPRLRADLSARVLAAGA